MGNDAVDGGVAEVATLTPLAAKAGSMSFHRSPTVMTNVGIAERGT